MRGDRGDAGAVPRLRLITVGTYLGMLEPKHLSDLYPARHEVTCEEMEFAQRAWKAFRSPDPTGLALLSNQDDQLPPGRH